MRKLIIICGIVLLIVAMGCLIWVYPCLALLEPNRSDYVPTKAEAEAHAELCRRCGSLPLMVDAGKSDDAYHGLNAALERAEAALSRNEAALAFVEMRRYLPSLTALLSDEKERSDALCEALLRISYLAFYAGRFAEARQAVEIMTTWDFPYCMRAGVLLAQAALAEGRPEQAIERMSRVQAYKEQDMRAQFLSARLGWTQGGLRWQKRQQKLFEEPIRATTWKFPAGQALKNGQRAYWQSEQAASYRRLLLDLAWTGPSASAQAEITLLLNGQVVAHQALGTAALAKTYIFDLYLRDGPNRLEIEFSAPEPPAELQIGHGVLSLLGF